MKKTEGGERDEIYYCIRTTESKDQFGTAAFYPCGKKVKYKVTYKNMNGKEQTEFVCGVHFQSLSKWSLRMKKIANYDSLFQFELLTPTPDEKR